VTRGVALSAVLSGLAIADRGAAIVPDGAFYLFVDCRDLLGRTTPTGTRLQNDLDITLYLLDEAHVAVIQGSAYGAPGFIRLSYATSMETIDAGIAAVAAAVEVLG